MIDGLNHLRRINRTSPEEVQPLVAMDRDELLDMLEQDAGGRPRFSLISGGLSGSSTRAGYVGATVAAAAAVIAAVFITGPEPTTDPDIGPAAEAEPAEAATPVQEPLVVDPPADTDDTQTASGGDTFEIGEAAEAEVPVESTVDEDSQTAGAETESNLPVLDGPFDPSVDLLVLHFDHEHRDDGETAVASLEMAMAHNLNPLVVVGTRVTDDSSEEIPLQDVMDAAWGDEWLNAISEREQSVNQSADRWLEAIENGGQVWVAEGGAADFTAEVIDQIQQQQPNLDTVATIQVVQHNESNESRSSDEDLEFVRDNSTYVRVQDGNQPNMTADLFQTSAGFKDAATSGPNGDAWSVAFGYRPMSEVDFSDLVEVFYILGIGTDQIADPGDFADFYLR